MAVLFRYLAREIYGATAMVLVAFLGLFMFFDFINELEDVGTASYQLPQAIVYVLLILPGRAYELLPVAVLIGSLYALTTLARHSEITVMRASGLSTGRMLRALGLIGSAFVVLTFLLGEYVAPPAESAAQQWKLTATQSSVSASFIGSDSSRVRVRSHSARTCFHTGSSSSFSAYLVNHS